MLQKNLSIVTMAVACALGSAAQAQTAATTLPKIRVEAESDEAGRYRAPRTSSATRTDTALREVPQSITIVDSALISDQAMQSMADVTRYVPGIVMGQGEGNRDQPSIRGNNTTADFYVDGMRDDVQYFRDLYNVERVEALKGPNAMIFGRGGGGGVLNRLTKQADWQEHREFSVQLGSYDQWRTSFDVGQAVNEAIAFRVNGMYEEAESFRDFVELDRFGINPTVSFALGDSTLVTLGYERFSDERTADRGIPSFRGVPLSVDESTFFGDPRLSASDIELNAFNALVEHEFGNGVIVRNRTRFTDYDKFYSNVFPGAVNAAGTTVSISAYNNDTQRENLFNQTDAIFSAATGSLAHTLLVGAEFGRQESENLRLTGFFNNVATSFIAPLESPTISVPVTFRASPNDGDNAVDVDVLSFYVQDQIQLAPQWQAVLGLRYEEFDLEFSDQRASATVRERARKDDFVSPRLGLIYQPIEALSLYASYSVSFLPSSGDQFSSLTQVTEGLKPEEFKNYELGAKWDLNDELAVGLAFFDLDRTNTRVADPANPNATIVRDQESRGAELQLTGAVTDAWTVFAGYTYLDAEIDPNSRAAERGNTVPFTPKNMLSVWNRYDVTATWGVGLGLIYQDEMFAAIDNSVTLPDFTRVDAAVFMNINESFRAQLNVENLFDEEYYPTAHSNNNISPGSPTAVRVSLTGKF